MDNSRNIHLIRCKWFIFNASCIEYPGVSILKIVFCEQRVGQYPGDTSMQIISLLALVSLGAMFLSLHRASRSMSGWVLKKSI